MTVTLPDNCHTSPSRCSPPPWSSQFSIKWHTCLYFSHLTEDCHNSWQLSHLPTHPYIFPTTTIPLHQLKPISNTFHTSLRTVTPPDNCLTFPHSLTPPPWSWPSHLSNWHSCFIPFHTSLTVTLPQGKWYTLCPFTSPDDHHTSPPTYKSP